MKLSSSRIVLFCYGVYLLLPLYWLLSMALRHNADIVGEFSVFPIAPTLANFQEIFANPVWYEAFLNSLTYVALNTIISLTVAIPAAYVFSRYRFLGDKQLFFWLLTNRMAPPAVFLLPFFQLYSAIGLFDTPLAVALAHCLFTVPLSVWILEGFMSEHYPRSLDEMARLDGHQLPVIFSCAIFLTPQPRGDWGDAVFLFYVQLGGAAVGADAVRQPQLSR